MHRNSLKNTFRHSLMHKMGRKLMFLLQTLDLEVSPLP